MSGHHSVTSMLTVLVIFMIIYFIALIIYEIKRRIKDYFNKKRDRK
ncbi:MAG: hypothetical protein K5894_06195 [Lachnospiraceae bacterium]|nr:hypothetical protein [Lachnospiraceae bacterium]